VPKTNRSRRARLLQEQTGCSYTQALALVANQPEGDSLPAPALIEVPGGQVELILRASEVPESRRDLLLEGINGVIAANWRATGAPWWSRQHSPFREDFGLAFFHAAGTMAGYFIFQRLTLDGIPVFYGAGTAVVPQNQGRRCYPLMQAHAVTTACRALQPTPDRIYVAWRTRNPDIWIANSRFCRQITPALWTGEEAPALQDACLRLAEILYPGAPIDPSTMVMHHVFDDLVELRPRRPPPGSMSARLAGLLADPGDAIFSLGVVDRSVLESIAGALSRR